MVKIAFIALFCLLHTISASKTKCFQCPEVTKTCRLNEATGIQCSEGSSCAIQIPVRAQNNDMAIRKCVIPTRDGTVPCPDGFNCRICDSDLCNSATTTLIGTKLLLLTAFIGFIIYL